MQVTNPLTAQNETIISALAPAFGHDAPATVATLSYMLWGTTDLVNCVEVALVDPLGAATVVKPLGVADANPYDVTAFYTGPGTYQLRLMEDGKGCGGGGDAQLASGTLDVGGCHISACTCECPVLSCTAGVNAATVCQGTAQIFTATPSGGIPPYIYEWDFSYDGVTFNVEGAGNPIVYAQPATGGYTVAARVTGSCATGAQTTICTVSTTVNANPAPDILPDAPVRCEADPCTVLDANPTAGTPPYTYLWSTGATSRTICASPAATTTYSVTVTGSNGCAASSNETLTVISTAPVITESNCSVWDITLDAGAGYASYLWSTGATTQTITVTGDGSSYDVTVTDFSGCQGSDSITTADCGALTWSRTYGGSLGLDTAYSVQQTTDGGYIVAGDTDSFGAGSYDIWVLKLDASGNVQWQKTFGGVGGEGGVAPHAVFVEQTTDGGFVMAGWTNSFGAGSRDIWVLRLDALGNVQWQKTYGGPSHDATNSAIQQTSDGGFIVSGYTVSFGAGSNDFWVLKLDASDNVAWQKTYGGASSDSANSIQQTTDGGFVVAGRTASFGAGGGDSWLLKLDASGNVAWQKTYGGTNNDSANSIQQTTDGGFIVSGYTYSFGPGSGDFWVLKLDASGNVVWQKVWGGADGDIAESAQQTTDGGYVVAGATWSFGAGGYDAWLLRLDALGNVTWQKTYGGASFDRARSIQQTTDGGYVVAGFTGSFGAGGYDFWVLKLDANGNMAPSCPFISDTGVTGVNSTASISNTGVSAVDSAAIIFDSAVAGVNSTAVVDEQCAGGCPVLSCTADVDAAAVCQGAAQTFTVTPSGGIAPYIYEWDFSYDGVTFNVEDTGNPIVYTQPAAGSYTVAARVTDSCATGAQTTICTVATTVNANPAPTITEGCDSCYGTVLDAGAGYASYLWGPGGETTRTIFSSCGSGPYSVTVTDASGCSGSDTGFFVSLCCDPFPNEPSAVDLFVVPPLIVEDPAAAQITLEKAYCAYNLYVGQLSDLASGLYDTTVGGTTCWIMGWTDNGDGTATLDVTIPDDSWFVLGESTVMGESSVGRDSDGTERTSMGAWALCGPLF
jgi:hypothetical protein